MNKSLWALAGIALLGTAGVAVALVIASSGNDDQTVRRVGTPTPALNSCDPRATPPDKQPWRWMDLVVLLPKKGFAAHPEYIPAELKPPIGGPGLNAGKYDLSGEGRVGASLLIDAETGAIVHTGAPEHGKATGIALCPFDPTTAPWPYNGDPPPKSTTMSPSIQPDPASGIYAESAVGAYAWGGSATPRECEIIGSGIGVHNWRSSASIGQDANTGAICKNLSTVQPEDLAAFQRFLDRVELCVYYNAEC